MALKDVAGFITQAGERVPVIFNGRDPRMIGTMESAPSAQAVRDTVDTMLFQQRLSCTYISVGEENGKRFVMAHG